MAETICSLYVRGLGNKEKRDQVFHWLKEKKFSIYLLQETHLSAQLKDQWQSEWDYHPISVVIKITVKVCVYFLIRILFRTI